jgi:hypothetical protein
MMKPSVGLTVLTSSFMILLTIVVFPALSRPLFPSARQVRRPTSTYSMSILISLSLSRAFLKIDSIFIIVMSDCFASANPAKHKARLPLLHLSNAANITPLQYIALTFQSLIVSVCTHLSLPKHPQASLAYFAEPTIALPADRKAQFSPRSLV